MASLLSDETSLERIRATTVLYSPTAKHCDSESVLRPKLQSPHQHGPSGTGTISPMLVSSLVRTKIEQVVSNVLDACTIPHGPPTLLQLTSSSALKVLWLAQVHDVKRKQSFCFTYEKEMKSPERAESLVAGVEQLKMICTSMPSTATADTTGVLGV